MLKKADLIEDLAAGCKPRHNWAVGIEHEQFIYNKRTNLPVAYGGKSGVRALLDQISTMSGWERLYEGGNVVALKNGAMYMTLEPGGAVEYSGSAMRTLDDVAQEYKAYLSVLQAGADALSIGILPAGFHPNWTHAQMPDMPKSRFKILKDYYATLPQYKKCIEIMYRSCTTQVSLDFCSEVDMVRKLRASIAMQPVAVALSANSSHVNGRNSGYESYRSSCWLKYDPSRTGILPFIFEDTMGFERYVDYLLDVPMLVTTRNGRNIDLTGCSFRRFMTGDLSEMTGECAGLHDWHEHMSCVFPEVRLKNYLEMRGADSGKPQEALALAAFWVGMLYNPDALGQICEMIEDWPVDMHHDLRRRVPQSGMDTVLWPGMTMKRFAREVLAVAEEGLLNNPQECDSGKFLDAFWNKTGTVKQYYISTAGARAHI